MRLSVIFLLVNLITVSCGNSDNNYNYNILGKVVHHTQCKDNLKAGSLETLPDTLSCVKYIFNSSSGILKLTHINAGFNCCPGDLFCSVALIADTIEISEYEEKAGCKCNCLYDLDMEISSVMSQKYVIKFVEPYASDKEKLIFDIDLSRDIQGSYCVVRKGYPWGMDR